MKNFIKFIVCVGIVAGILINELWLHSGVFQHILYGFTSIFAMIGVCVLVDWMYDKKE